MGACMAPCEDRFVWTVMNEIKICPKGLAGAILAGPMADRPIITYINVTRYSSDGVTSVQFIDYI